MTKYTDLMIVGLHDADGSFENSLSPRVGVNSYGLVLRITFSQKTANCDTIDKVYETLGETSKVINSVRSERKDSFGRDIEESSAVFNTTTPEGQRLLGIFQENKPLAPGKRRDYLIFLKILLFKNTGVFEELNSSCLSSELNNLNRHKIGLIACIWLMFHNAQSLKYNSVERERRKQLMNEKMNNLIPLQEELRLGVDLGKYCLSFIEEEQKNIQVSLRNNFKLPNDYMIGLFIGDGWFTIYLKIDPEKPKLKVVVSFNMIQSADCIDVLYAFQSTLDGKGSIAADSKTKTAYVFKLEGIKNCIEYILPLFDNYELQLPSTKKKQYSLFREVLIKIKEKNHLTPDGLDDIINLAYEFTSLSQGSRGLTKDEQKSLAVQYFRKRNIL
jgi:hypothetical protein